jgi:hypothetical protein
VCINIFQTYTYAVDFVEYDSCQHAWVSRFQKGEYTHRMVEYAVWIFPCDPSSTGPATLLAALVSW